MLQIATQLNHWKPLNRESLMWDDAERFINEMGFSYWGTLYTPRSKATAFSAYPVDLTYNIAINHPVTTQMQISFLDIYKGQFKLPKHPYIPFSVAPFRFLAFRKLIDHEFDAMASYQNNIPRSSSSHNKVATLLMNTTDTSTTRDGTTGKLGNKSVTKDLIVTENATKFYGNTETVLTIANGSDWDIFHVPSDVEKNRVYPDWDETKKDFVQWKYEHVADPKAFPYRTIKPSQQLYGCTMTGIPNVYMFTDQLHWSQGHGLAQTTISEYTYLTAGMKSQYILGEISKDGVDHLVSFADIAPGSPLHSMLVRDTGGFIMIGAAMSTNGLLHQPQVGTEVYIGPYGELQMGVCAVPIQIMSDNGEFATVVSNAQISAGRLFHKQSRGAGGTSKTRVILTDTAAAVRYATIDSVANSHGTGVGLINLGGLKGATIAGNRIHGCILSENAWAVGKIFATIPYQFEKTLWANSQTGDRFGGSPILAHKLSKMIFDSFAVNRPGFLEALGYFNSISFGYELIRRKMIGTVDYRFDCVNDANVHNINLDWFDNL